MTRGLKSECEKPDRNNPEDVFYNRKNGHMYSNTLGRYNCSVHKFVQLGIFRYLYFAPNFYINPELKKLGFRAMAFGKMTFESFMFLTSALYPGRIQTRPRRPPGQLCRVPRLFMVQPTQTGKIYTK
jgi:capsule polysaccharide modification protein KpsS